jgi:putative addiction module killer protein
MYSIQQTALFDDWLRGLKDRTAKARIEMRLRRAAQGNLGDVRTVGAGVSEMRVDHGPGYRLYFTLRDRSLVILLCGGDKGSQARDIVEAQSLARQV